MTPLCVKRFGPKDWYRQGTIETTRRGKEAGSTHRWLTLEVASVGLSWRPRCRRPACALGLDPE